MNLRTLIITLMTLLLFACPSSDPAPTTSGTPVAPPTGAPDATSTPEAAAFGSPTAAVNAFITAAGAKDKEALRECFAAEAPGEFASLRDGSAPDEALAELAEFTAGASVGEEKIDGDKAMVSVKFSKRDETINLVKEGDSWRILDF